MRLGAYNCYLEKDTLAAKIYGVEQISERHRHRLEVNNQFVPALTKAGMVISGNNRELGLVEMIELSSRAFSHPFFIACQFHPEFKSRPYAPHPIFAKFIEMAKGDTGGANK